MKENSKNRGNKIEKVIPEETGFKTPKNYFEKFEDKIFLKLSEDKFPKESGFETPHLYFDNIDEKILEKVILKEKRSKVYSLKKRAFKMITYSAAASIILFIALNIFLTNNKQEINIDSLTESDIEFWISNNEINYDDIAIILEEEILNEDDFSLTSIKNESIEDYLISRNSPSILTEIN